MRMSEHVLIFTAGVSQPSVGTLTGYLTSLQATGATRLTLAISSPGGQVVAGITMFNVLLAMPYEIITHNIGNVDSIAVALFLAGKRRLSNANATFMFHGVGFDSNPAERLEEKNLLEKLDVIEAENKRISQLIAARSQLSEQACLELLKQQKTRDVAWSQTAGMVDSVEEFVVQAGADVKYLA